MRIEARDDGLIIPEVGIWAKRKYHYLGRYLEAFTTAMKGKRWDGLYYIDVCCGAGFAKIKQSTEIVPSSPILAANVEHAFSRLHLCDLSEENIDACRQRLQRASLPNDPRLLVGDANERVHELLSGISSRSLSVAFLDPFGLHIWWETVARIAEKNADLIILLPDHMDALRNYQHVYASNPESNLDRFLGADVDWRQQLNHPDSSGRAQQFRELYEQKLGTLGYNHFDFKRVENTIGVRLYILLFASRSPAGLKLWQGISAIDEGGQRELF